MRLRCGSKNGPQLAHEVGAQCHRLPRQIPLPRPQGKTTPQGQTHRRRRLGPRRQSRPASPAPSPTTALTTTATTTITNTGWWWRQRPYVLPLPPATLERRRRRRLVVFVFLGGCRFYLKSVSGWRRRRRRKWCLAFDLLFASSQPSPVYLIDGRRLHDFGHAAGGPRSRHGPSHGQLSRSLLQPKLLPLLFSQYQLFPVAHRRPTSTTTTTLLR